MARANNEGPRGRKVLNFSPGKMNPGAGIRTAASGVPEYVCRLWGEVAAHEKIESTIYPGTVNTVFHGRFGFQSAAGVTGAGMQAYLPGIIRRGIIAALDKGQPSVPCAIELWTAPDPRPGRAGFFYDVYDCLAGNGDDAADAIAIAAGFLPRPQRVIGQAQPEAVDPETGEFLESMDKLEDRLGLPPLEGGRAAAE
jgi:hypothetical protein